MPVPAPRPRSVALANLFFPGTGYLLMGRRVVLGAILVGYTMITVALSIMQLSTLFAHYAHVAPDGLPGIVGIIVLFAIQQACICVGTALDGHEEARRLAADRGTAAAGAWAMKA